MVDIKEIRKLSVQDRIEMVEAIWDTIAEDSLLGGSLTKEQDAEISRRIDLLAKPKPIHGKRPKEN